MPKTYVGGTVEVTIAQKFRFWAKKYYNDNMSEALENALAHFDRTISTGEIPRFKVVKSTMISPEYEKVKT